MRPLLELLRRIVDLAGAIVLIVLTAAFVLQFPHPPRWDSLAAVVRLHEFLDPLLGRVGAAVGLPWPSRSMNLMPLGLAFGVFALRAMAHGGLGAIAKAWEAAEKKRRSRSRAPAPPAGLGGPPPATSRPALQPSAPPPPPAGAAAGAPVPLEAFLGAEPHVPDRPGPRSGVATRLPPPPAPAHPTTRPQSDPTAVEAPTVTPAGAVSIAGQPPPATVHDRDRPPTRIGRYEIEAMIGHGAMGVVYRAHDPQIDRKVAIKSILGEGLNKETFDQFKQRFYREAKAAGRLHHPGIVAIHDVTEDESGKPAIVMEFVQGATLEQLAQERLPLGQVLDLCEQVAEALAYAHRNGVVHRDVKPANILVTDEGRTKITDFGVAKLEGVRITQTGALVGTPAFMSPEQFTGGAIDGRSDLFSLGSILHWLCTGERPFPGDTLTTIAFRVVQTAPVPARQLNPALPPDIDVILARLLAKSPDGRYPDGRDVARDMRALRAGTPLPSTDPGVTFSG